MSPLPIALTVLRGRQIRVQLNGTLGSCAIVVKGTEHGDINAFSIDGELGETSHRQLHSKYARKINGCFFQSEKGGKGVLGRGVGMNQLGEPAYL